VGWSMDRHLGIAVFNHVESIFKTVILV